VIYGGAVAAVAEIDFRRSLFFFEKKNQKTFLTWVSMPARKAAAAGRFGAVD
jgi:hypothetical protein